MSWTGLVYIFAGLFGVFYVLPKVFWLIADGIHRYIHAASPDASPDAISTEETHPRESQKAVVAFKPLPPFETEAKQKQKEHGGVAAESKRNASGSSYRSGARGQAAKATSGNRQYVSEVKRIAEKVPELIPRILSGEVNMLQALKKPRLKQAG